MPEIDENVLRFAFGDLFYDMTNAEKSTLRKTLVVEGKNIGARKVRMAINAHLGGDEELKRNIRAMYIDRATLPQKMIGKVLLMTIPSVASVAQSYFTNAQDYYTVGNIADICNMTNQANNISQNIGRFRVKRGGIIRSSESSGIILEDVRVGGQAGTAYKFVEFGHISKGRSEPDLVLTIQPRHAYTLEGAAKDVYAQIASHRNRGAKTIYHRISRRECISIYKIKDGIGLWTEIEITQDGAIVRHVDSPARKK